MAQCAAVVMVGAQEVLAPSIADPCTTFVLLTPTEYAGWQSSPLNLSPSDGLLLSAAIVGVWAAAFGWRALVRVLNSNDGDSSGD